MEFIQMKMACQQIAKVLQLPEYTPTFTLVIVQKRHHTRFWAKNIDMNIHRDAK